MTGPAPTTGAAPLTDTLQASIGLLKRTGGAIAWYVRDLMGDTAYQRYRDHHLAHHGPEHPPMSEREFWRQRMDEQDRNPGARCC